MASGFLGEATPAFDVRAQILDNARALGRMHMKSPGEKMPDHTAMNVIVYGNGTTIKAKVVTDNPASSGENCTFIETGDNESIEVALRNLLGVTMVMLNKDGGFQHGREGTQFEKIQGFGNDGYYTLRK